MRITLRELRRRIRQLIEHGVDTEMRLSAGICAGGLGISSNVTDREAILNPPPGLGDPDVQQEPIDDEEQVQRKSQAGARFNDRHAGRSSRT